MESREQQSVKRQKSAAKSSSLENVRGQHELQNSGVGKGTRFSGGIEKTGSQNSEQKEIPNGGGEGEERGKDRGGGKWRERRTRLLAGRQEKLGKIHGSSRANLLEVHWKFEKTEERKGGEGFIVLQREHKSCIWKTNGWG